MFADGELDIFLVTLEIRYMLISFAFDMLPAATRFSLAPQGISSCEATYRAVGYIERRVSGAYRRRVVV